MEATRAPASHAFTAPQPAVTQSAGSAHGPGRKLGSRTPPGLALLHAVERPVSAGACGGSRRSWRRSEPLTENTNKIHVAGFPSYIQAQELVQEFKQFGAVKVEQLAHQFACLAFNTPEAAKAALQSTKKVRIYGEPLTVKPYNAKLAAEGDKQPPPVPRFPLTKKKCVIVEPRFLDLRGDFHTQLDTVLNAVRLTQGEATAISALYRDLEHVLQYAWPGCIAMPFGSITTGLGIKTSDADCYVHIPGQYHMNSANFVHKAKRILQSHTSLFAEILSIPRANTPIVKFFHIPTETNCDLSFKTPLGAQNSKLIAFLLHADTRLLPMAVLIKYWAKVHGLSGTGRLTNYALTMLIIFYLQQQPMSILPSVSWLQRDCANDIIVDYWNTGFMDKRDALPPSSNTSSIPELIGGFFEYYSLFNFDEMAVCPFLGTPIKKETFKNLDDLPDVYELYKINVYNKVTPSIRYTCSICVQDPFEQCHNVASAITSRLAAEIKAYFKFAANSYEKEKLNNCEEFLRTILLQKPKIVRTKAHPEFRINLFPRIVVNIINPDWKNVIKQIVLVLFENMLKIKLGKVEEKVNPDSKKEKEKFLGTVMRPIWKRRAYNNVIQKYGLQKLDFAVKQERITEEIIKSESQEFNMQFQLHLVFAHNPKSAVMSIRFTAGDSDAFREFGNFFISTCQGWVLTLLKVESKPIGNDTAAKIAEMNTETNFDDVGMSPIEIMGANKEAGDNASSETRSTRSDSDDRDDLNNMKF